MIGKRFHPAIDEIAPLIIEALEDKKEVKLTVTGFSMYPVLRSITDCVLLEKAGDINKYDVVLFKRQNGSYILHRVIKKKGNILTIAGDNERIKEYPVDVTSCIARMKGFWRGDRYHSVNELWYRFYSVFWLLIFPMRSIATRGFFYFARWIRKVKKAKKKSLGR